jgi:hypothetical protein
MLMMPFAVRVKLSSDESDLPSGRACGNDRACALLRSEVGRSRFGFPWPQSKKQLNASNNFLNPGLSSEPGIRKRLVSGFPFSVLYEIQPDRIYIAAVMHQHRRPGYWLKRVE